MRPTIKEKILAIERFKDYWAAILSRTGLTEDFTFMRSSYGFSMYPSNSNLLTHKDLLAIHTYSEEHLMPYIISSAAIDTTGRKIIVEFDLTK